MVWWIVGGAVVLVGLVLAWISSGRALPLSQRRKDMTADPAVIEARMENMRHNSANGPWVG